MNLRPLLPLIALAAALVLAVGCRRTPEEQARHELEKTGVAPVPAEAVEAARIGDTTRLETLGRAGLDLTRPDEAGEAPLLAALRAGHMEAARELSEAYPRTGTASGGPVVPAGALAWALARRDAPLVDAFLQRGADPNAPIPTPAPEDFIVAVDSEKFAYYLRKERDVRPLMLAAATGQEEAARLLLAAGARRLDKTARHGTTAIWLAGQAQHVGVVQLLLGKSPRPEDQRLRLTVDLSQQKVFLHRDGAVVDSSPVSTGRKGFATPKGRFVVTNKYRDWKSTLYEDASMPFFMRLSCGDFGLHAGALPGYPASHGCIRMPLAKAQAFFAKVEVGTLVEIVD